MAGMGCGRTPCDGRRRYEGKDGMNGCNNRNASWWPVILDTLDFQQLSAQWLDRPETGQRWFFFFFFLPNKRGVYSFVPPKETAPAASKTLVRVRPRSRGDDGLWFFDATLWWTNLSSHVEVAHPGPFVVFIILCTNHFPTHFDF